MTYEEYFERWQKLADKIIQSNMNITMELIEQLNEQTALDEMYPAHKAQLDVWIKQKAAEHDAAKQTT